MSEIKKILKASTIHQRFSLPEALVFFMANNPPSPEVYHKLIRCCKYFWFKNPVITLNDLYHCSRDKYWRTYKMNGFQGFKRFEIENFKEKLWIYQDLNVFRMLNTLLASSIIPRIYRCDLTSLTLSDQTLSFNEFQKLTSSGSLVSLYLKKTSMKNDGGTIVPIETLIEVLPNLEAFEYHNVSIAEGGLQTITSETAANLNALPHFPQISNYTMGAIPESFNFEAFFATPKVRTFPVFN